MLPRKLFFTRQVLRNQIRERLTDWPKNKLCSGFGLSFCVWWQTGFFVLQSFFEKSKHVVKCYTLEIFCNILCQNIIIIFTKDWLCKKSWSVRFVADRKNLFFYISWLECLVSSDGWECQSWCTKMKAGKGCKYSIEVF